MKQIFLSTLTDLEEIHTFEPGSWINLVNPSQSESMEVAEHFNIDIADLRAPLDAEESSRIVVEDDYKLINCGRPNLGRPKQPGLLCHHPARYYLDRKYHYHYLLRRIISL